MRHSEISLKPIDIDLRKPLPGRIRLYLYNATHPPGGRTLGEHKIQLIVPGQKPKQTGSFDHKGNRIVLLAGYQCELEVFILWDSGLYPIFSYSRNVQVHPEVIYSAYAGNIGEQRRKIRGKGEEIVITSNAFNLCEAICKRIEYTINRIAQ